MSLRALGYLVGAGSMSLGVEAAGFNLEEIWETPGYAKNAETWRLNRPDKPINVLELDYTNPHFSRYQGLDLLYGNPPCGGLSSMTCSRISSPTNNCMRQWIRMVVHARPRLLLMENAYQLAMPRVKPLLTDLTDVLDAAGYYWWTWMFYSYQIGTPQIRRRMFLCASLDTPKNSEMIALRDLPDSRDRNASPCGKWLETLVGVEPSPHPVIDNNGSTVTQHWYESPSKMLEMQALARQHWDRLGTKWINRRRFEKFQELARGGDVEAIKQLPRLEKIVWDDVPKQFNGMCMHRPTILKWDRAAPAIIGSYKYISPIDKRFLTMREIARLMGYPDWWQFHRLRPSYIAQGIPVTSAFWAADRMLRVLGER